MFATKIEWLDHILMPARPAAAFGNINARKTTDFRTESKLMRPFLDACIVCKRFIESFSKITWLLNGYLRKNKKFHLLNLTTEALDVFYTTKLKVMNPSVLFLPQPHRRYVIDIDASAYVLEAVLF